MHPNIQLYDFTLRSMEQWFDVLASKVPQPVRVKFGESFTYRFAERTPQQAILQKLARCISTLDAAHILLLNGLVQEQGAMQRILDELNEDVAFIAGGLLKEWTKHHSDLLDAFYQEEFDDPQNPPNSVQKRPMRRADKIRAFNARVLGDGDPSTQVKNVRFIQKTYSGYVHPTSPHIMDMYGGEPPRFHLRGMLGTSRATEHLYDIWNYFYRGIGTFAIASYALDEKKLGDHIQEAKNEFERLSIRERVKD